METVGKIVPDLIEKITQPAPSSRPCPVHGDLVPDQSLFFGGREVIVPGRCLICQGEEISAEAAAQRREAELRRLQARREAGICERYVRVTIGNFREDTNAQQDVGKAVRAFVNGGWEQSPGLLFLGPPGTGKTMLACAIVSHWLDHHQGRSGISARYFTMLELMRRVKRTWNHESVESEDQAFQRLTDLPLLVVDEVGVQFGSQTESMIFHEIIDRRYGAMTKPTILISNLTVEECARVLGEPVMDRFRDGGHALAFTWPSQRGAKSTA